MQEPDRKVGCYPPSLRRWALEKLETQVVLPTVLIRSFTLSGLGQTVINWGEGRRNFLLGLGMRFPSSGRNIVSDTFKESQ